MTILAALMFILTMLFVGVLFFYTLRFLTDLTERMQSYQSELSKETSERVIVVVQETAKAVSQAIAPTPLFDNTQPDPDMSGLEETNPPSTEYVPWYQQTDGGFGVDPTDEFDEYLTGTGNDVGRVASIRPGEEINVAPGTPTVMPAWARPNLAGEQA